MNKFLLTLFFITAFLVQSNGQWYNVSSAINDASFAGQTGYSVGVDGTIRKSKDGGQTWQLLNSGVVEDLQTVQVINNQIGYAAGGGGVFLKTIDGGNTWSQQVIYPSFPSSIESIWFLDANLGYIVNEFGNVFKTADGGKTWSAPKNVANSNSSNNNICFVSTLIGYVNTTNGIYKTIDGGSNWTSTGSYGDYIYFVNATNGFKIYNGSLYKTINSGTSWTLVSALNGVPSKILFNGALGLITSGSYLYYTNDNGNNWSSWNTNIGRDMYGAWRFDNNNVLALGDRSTIIKSTNAGAKWDTISYAIDFSGAAKLYTANFANDTTVYTAGNNYIGKSFDAGVTWKPIQTFSNDFFNDSYFYNADTGYVAGSSIYKTKNAGKTWSKKTIPTTQYINGIAFITPKVGFAVANWGTLIQTNDYGETWTTVTLSTSKHLKAIQFLNDTIGFITGESDAYLKTLDGGKTWNVITDLGSPYGDNLTIACIDTFAYCSGDFLFRTNDHTGKIWSNIFNTSCDMDDLYFINPSEGYMLQNSGGYSCGISKTLDSGKTWSDESWPFFVAPLNSISFAKNKKDGVIAAEDGYILKKADVSSTVTSLSTPFISSSQNNLLTVYPNPSVGVFKVKLTYADFTRAFLSVSDITGKLLRYQAIEFDGGNAELDLSSLEKGIYLLKVTAGEKILNQKIEIYH